MADRTHTISSWLLGAGLLGGVSWAAKGGAIILTGEQPPVVYALGPPLFALGLIGVHFRLRGRGGKPAACGVGVAVLSLAASVAVAVGALVAPELRPEGEEFTALSIPLLLAGLSLVAALVLLGVAARRAQVPPGGWRHLLLAMGLGLPALTVLFGALAVALEDAQPALGERLLEPPLLLYGLAWVALASRLLVTRS